MHGRCLSDAVSSLANNNREFVNYVSRLMTDHIRIQSSVLSRLLAILLLLGAAGFAQAAEKFCSDAPYFGVIDGNVLANPPTQISVDTSCTFRNWPQSNPLTTTINFNFQSGDPLSLIVFDNVYYTGNMACSNTEDKFKIWFANSAIFAGNNQCQDLFIPLEKIDKQSPAATATVGVPFTYTLTIPVLFDPASGAVINNAGSANNLGNIRVTDDLTAVATGAEMTLVGINAYVDGTGTVIPVTNTGDSKHLDFTLPDINAGQQVVVEITVVLDDVPANANGTIFANTAKWVFSRAVDINENGIIEPGEFFSPLPGEWGISQPMTIAEPSLVVTKSTSTTALNLTDTATFTIDAQNAGGSAAWNAAIVDIIPVGMCVTNPAATLTARVVAADGVTLVRNLVAGADYTALYSPAPTCRLDLAMTDAGGGIAPNQHLVLTYQTQLDPGFTADGATLTNVAGATQWFNGSSSTVDRRTYNRVITDGTPGVVDHQDNQTVTAGLSGYYFEKTVENLATSAYPGVTAASGDRLRYRLRLFNIDQNINNITISDTLNVLTHFVGSSFGNVVLPAGATHSFNAVTGQLTITGSGGPLNLPVGGELEISFEITLRTGLVNGTVVGNQASLIADGAFAALSDDPYVNGVADPDVAGDEDRTEVVIVTPGALTKTNPLQTSVTIGEQFTYRIAVPAVPVAEPLYDVRLLDNLPANLRFVSASVVSGGSWTVSNTSGSNTSLVIVDAVSGIDIPANGQAAIDITVEVDNAAVNQSGVTFNNTASYTYNRRNGDVTTQTAGAGSSTANMSVIEPVLSISKVVRNVTPGKAIADPATGGDILEYVITIPGSGNSTAHDVNVADTLPPELALVAGSATAAINGTPVAGFVVNPSELSAGLLIWGRDNGDETLDIPVGQTLVLTYRVNVVAVSGTSLTNSAFADWTSLPGANGAERTGTGCPAITAPDDYCAGPATATVTTVDTNALVKSVLSDSWSTAPSTGGDAVLRVGDTVVYRLALTLREGQTRNVVVRDTLPAGLVFDSMVSINGDAVAPFAAAAPFTHADIAAPVVAGSTVTWAVGDVVNAIDNSTANDSFIIEYRARVITNTLAHVASTTLANAAEFSYTDGSPRTGSANIEVRQPVIVTVTKSDRLGRVGPSSAAPLNVNVASDVMQFRLQACNASGSTAPAYSVRLVDTLASQLDETSLTTPVVTVNGAAQTAGADYLYTPPVARGGTMTFVLNTPVNPGQCAVIDYDIGFHTDVAPNQLWNNSVSTSEYWSLPAASGQQYPAVGPAEFWMTNASTDPLPLKSLLSPVSEATIGEAVVYRITIPAINAARTNVVVTDTLPAALVYDSASVAGAFVMTDNSVAPGQVSLTIALIPAGQQVVITLNAHVANDAATNAGTTFSNQASYTYAGYSGPALVSAPTAALTLVEPSVTVNKAVTPTTPPVAGNILHYTVDLAATSGATLSSAYDLGVVDSLSLGLAYVAGSATVGGVAVEPVVGGDGVTTPQVLTWSGIDIPEGTAIAVEYDVRVLNGVSPSQVLSNSVTARWTSLDGASANERNGSTSPAHNDYVASDSTSLGAPDNTTLLKSRLGDTFNAADANLRIGDRVEYELRLGLQEGTHNNLVLSDVLPTGLVFESVVSATFFGTPGVANPVVSGQTLTWNLGTVTNAADGNAANDFLIIVYRARVLNNDTLAQAPTTQSLVNSASLNYTLGGVPVLPKTDTESVTVLQPSLAVSKSVAPAGGDSVVVAGEVITYTVDISNSGTAPAYDTVLNDTLPVGLRQGGVTTVAISLANAGTVLPVIAPAYSAVTGVATWNFDNGVANTYTIPAGDSLRVVYTVQADADVGASRTLGNAATASLYYSFDDDAVPAGGVSSEREVYGPSNTAVATVTTPGPGALQKAVTQATAVVGEQFTYRITVPAVPVSTALHDVRITDDLDASAADLRFVSVTKIAGSGIWTPVNTGTATQLVIEDVTTGIDIPAGEQVTVDITVELLDTATNVSGLVFSNAANYTYNAIANTPATQTAGLPGTSGNMTIVGPDSLTLTKSGPATMRFGQPGTFTLDVQNTGGAQAWDLTLTDRLPNPTPGGMCATTPSVISARVFAADGVTPVSALLVAGTDFSVAFVAGAPTCTFTFTGLSAAAAPAPLQRLIVTYQAALDADTPSNLALTNVAGVTEWFSQDTAGAGATGETRVFSRTVTDGTVGTVDHEDAHTLTTEPPTMVVEKTVFNVTTGQPGTTARPGDRLRYRVRVTNISPVTLPSFALRDDIGALNATAVFVPGSLALTTVPAGADTTATVPAGGTNGAGLVDVRNLSLGPQGSATDVVLVEFEVTLASVINSGTVVLNQGVLTAFGATIANTDDPGVNGADDPDVMGDEDPTQTRISSAPVWRVQKISDDLTGDTAVLMPGDTLRYTLTVKNIGNENASNVSLRDLIPSFTTYVANTTRLNGVVVADPAAGVSPLQGGLLINAPGNTSVGAMDADASATPANVATITFNVVVNSSALGGTVISNQGFVNGTGAGGGTFSEQPSDDPAVNGADDPAVIGDEDLTRDIVGNLPLLNAQKRVAIVVDNNGNGIANAGDTLRYTLTVSNAGAVPATGVILTDTVPANTSYVAGSTTLNGGAVADSAGAVLPLSDDEAINSPSAASGTIAVGASAVVAFDVTINTGVADGTVISNQGQVDSTELPADLTDADGVDSNGDQPTTIVVGSAQQLTILKEVFVVGGGPALPGGQLEYVVRVTNTGTTPATQVVLTDDMTTLSGQASFITGSATLNGSTNGVSYVAPALTANYAATYGTLPAGATATLRFRVQISGTVASGTVLSNTGRVSWDVPTVTASSTVDVTIGAVPGSATLSGRVWHDADFDNTADSSERNLSGWSVEVYRSSTLLGSSTTDASGLYSLSGLAPTVTVADQYELRFTAPGANAGTTARLGLADSVFTNELQRITGISAGSGSNVQNLNLPIDPNGVVYNSITRAPVAGARLTLVNGSGAAVDRTCFVDPVQQDQMTQALGFYKFDLNFSHPSCPAGNDYLIQVTPPASGYESGLSRIIPPSSSADTAAYDVPFCPGDTNAGTGECEVQSVASAPSLSVPARTAGTVYYLHLSLNNTAVPADSQIFNNHIALDPVLANVVSISKTSALVNVSRGQIVPYVITVRNALGVPLADMGVVDTFPVGFKYVAGSSRVDGQPVEPVITNRQLSWNGLQLGTDSQRTIKMLFIVGSGVSEGEYVNRARVLNTVTAEAVSGEATASVRVVPDPTFDCTDVIGKVFDDANLNGYQDAGEKGLPGVRLATARGLLVTTDDHGRYHITCAVTPDEARGSNFILKVDDRTLPSGYRMTTENPRVLRATRGKMMKFNFGATLHKVVRLDVANGVFEPGSTDMRIQWTTRMSLLLRELKKAPSVLRLAYMAEVEDEALVEARLKAFKQEVKRLWAEENNPYELTIETEVFWRTGAPPARSRNK